MSHTTKNKAKLLARVRRMKGQLAAMETALEAGAPCHEILNMAASVRGAMTGLTAELIEDHIRGHVANPETDPDPERAKGAGELIDVIRTYLR
ncbi:metal/formaldehyde-sensitive transcriptional repressor [Ciceribacter ferrooxidans]|uniref:Metal/formaldehyde-sensitive transcriptional repressor n=1 Tax=Ciceribacter ferrooxidans TaxID=2509717 RepID=A0A4Q2T2C5_9HYPH|nr:metal/formaldehyde-sensitive transcriptional repressor [Ciceribacter ferrooxidans]RYC12053.1 metal/formaldehyde-sensitive transcriptional repressor [Ciceribacter ferrooxidans]